MKKLNFFTIITLIFSFSTLVYAGSFFSVWEIFQKKQNQNYCDMQENWASSAAEYLFENNILKGECINGNYYFYPEKSITRGEFITYISEILELPDTDEKITFKDESETPKSQLIHAKRAYSAKIINGNAEADGLYLYLSDNLTRNEAFHIIFNALPDATFPTVKMNFADGYTLSEKDMEVVSRLMSEGFINGYSDNTIRPYTKLTKAQAASLIYNLVKKMPDFKKF